MEVIRHERGRESLRSRQFLPVHEITPAAAAPCLISVLAAAIDCTVILTTAASVAAGSPATPPRLSYIRPFRQPHPAAVLSH